jgi:SAM-dependent methyltransferase
MQIDDRIAKENNIQGHQQSYFNYFLNLYDVQGKDILEIGGAMPSTLVLDFLAVKSWTCVQSSDYEKYRSDNQIPSQERESSYSFIYGNLEEFAVDSRFENNYDAIFSIACFEHIHKLPEALKVMYKSLRPEGKLFSMFSPIWSGPWGQHYTSEAPARFDSIRPAEGWTTQSIFSGPWDHLLLSRLQFFEHYKAKFDEEFAAELMYMTFNSPQVNRYFFEDYIAFIRATGFKELILNGLFTMPDSPETAQSLTILRNRYLSFGYANFSDAGIVAFLRK